MRKKISISLMYYSLAVNVFFWDRVSCSYQSEILTDTSLHVGHFPSQANPSSPPVNTHLKRPSELTDLLQYFESIIMTQVASGKQTRHAQSSIGLPSSLSTFLNYGKTSAPEKKRETTTTRDKTMPYSALAKEAKNTLVLIKSLRYLTSGEKRKTVKPNLQEIKLLYDILSKSKTNRNGDKKDRYFKPVSERKETLRESTIKTTNGNKFMFTLADLAGIFRASNNHHNETGIRKKQNEKAFPSSNSAQQYSPVDLEFMKSFISLVNQITSKSKMTNTDVHSNIKRKNLNTDRITGRVDPEQHHSIQQEKGMGTETSYRQGESLKPKNVWKTPSAGTEDTATGLMSNSDSKMKQNTFVLSSRENQNVHDILKLPKSDNPEKFNRIQRTKRKDEIKSYVKRHPMPNSFRKDSTYHRSSSFINKSNMGNERHILKSEYFGHSPTVRLDQRPSISDLNKYISFSDVHRDVKPTTNRFSLTRSNPTSRRGQERRNIVPFDKYNKHVNRKQPHVVHHNPININMEHHKTRNPSLQGHQSLNQVQGLKRHQLTPEHKVRSMNSNSPISDSQFFINQQSEQSGQMGYAVNNDLIPATPVHQSPNKIINQDRSFYDINAERANVRDNLGTRLPTNTIPVKQQSRINYIEVSNNVPARNRELVASVRHGTESQRYKFSNGLNSRRESIESSKDYNSVRNIRHQISNQETSSSLPLQQSPSQRPRSQNSNNAIPHYTSGANTHTPVIPHTENMSINIKRHHVKYTNHPKHVESYRTDHNVPSGYLGGSQGKRSERLDLHQKSPQNSNVPMAHSSQLHQRNGYPVSANTEIQTYNRGQNGLNKNAGSQQSMYSKNHDSFLPKEIQQINDHDMTTGIVKSNVHPYTLTKVNDNRYNDKGIQQASSGGMLDKHNRPESSRYTKQSRMVSIEQPPTENQHTIQMSSDANIFHVDAIRNGNHKATPRSDVYQPFNNVMRNQDRTIHTQAGYGVAHNTEIPPQDSNGQIIESHFYDPVTIQPPGPPRYSEGTNHQSQHFPSIRQQAVKYVQTKVVPHEAPGQNKELHKTILGTTGSIKNVPSSKYSTNSSHEYQNVNRQQHLRNSHSVNNLRTAHHHQQQHHKMIDVANKLVSTIREPELMPKESTHIHHNSPLQKVAAPTQLVPSSHVNNHERKIIQKSNKHHTPRQQRVIELVNKVTTRISVDHGGVHTRQEPKQLTSYEKSKPRPQYDPSVVQHEPVSPGKIVLNQKYPPVETSDNLTALRTELYSLLSRIDRLQTHGSPQNAKQAKQAAPPVQAAVFQSPYKSRTFPPNQTRLNKEPYNRIGNNALSKFQNTRNVNIEKTNIHRQSNGQIVYTRQPENLPNFVDRVFPRKVQNGVPVKFQNPARYGILQSQSSQSFHGGNLKNAHKNVKFLNVPLSSNPDKFPDPSVRIHVTAETHSSIPNHSVSVSKQLMTANSTASKTYIPFTEHNIQINKQHAYAQEIISPKQQTSLQTTNNTSRHIVEKSKYKREKATNLPKLRSRGVRPYTYQQKYSTPMQSNFHRKQGNQIPAAEIKLHIQPSSHDVRFEVSVQGRKQISKPNLQILTGFQNVFNATKGSNTPHLLSSTRMPVK